MVAVRQTIHSSHCSVLPGHLYREKAEITAQLAEAPADVPDVHPGIAEIYKRKVERLTETLADPETRLDASCDIRSLVGKIVLHPGTMRGEVHATLRGLLMGILDFANDNPSPDAGRVITSVSPGSRAHLYYNSLEIII